VADASAKIQAAQKQVSRDGDISSSTINGMQAILNRVIMLGGLRIGWY
jgi:hypothetical protein